MREGVVFLEGKKLQSDLAAAKMSQQDQNDLIWAYHALNSIEASIHVFNEEINNKDFTEIAGNLKTVVDKIETILERQKCEKLG
jgi:hypothetical protein